MPADDEVRQGKCTTCRIRITWPARLMRLDDAYCYVCGRKLERTTRRLLWPVRRLRTSRPCNAREARKRRAHYDKARST